MACWVILTVVEFAGKFTKIFNLSFNFANFYHFILLEIRYANLVFCLVCMCFVSHVWIKNLLEKPETLELQKLHCHVRIAVKLPRLIYNNYLFKIP